MAPAEGWIPHLLDKWLLCALCGCHPAVVDRRPPSSPHATLCGRQGAVGALLCAHPQFPAHCGLPPTCSPPALSRAPRNPHRTLRPPKSPAHPQPPATFRSIPAVHPWSPAHPQPRRTHSFPRTPQSPAPCTRGLPHTRSPRARTAPSAPATSRSHPVHPWSPAHRGQSTLSRVRGGGLSNDGPELVLWGGSPSPRGHLCRPAWGAESTPRSPAGVRPPGAPYPHTNHDEVVLAVRLERLVEAERLCRDSAQHGPAGGGGDQRGRGAEWDQRGAGGRGRGQRGARGEGSGRC